MYHIVKGPQAMMMFQGRKSNETSNNDDYGTKYYKDIYARVKTIRS